MATVFVIEQGEYSDYRVVGVFSSRANAERVASLIDCGDTPRVDEWPMDPAIESLNQGHSQFLVWMQRDGTVERCEVREPSGYELDGKAWIWPRSTAPAYIGKGLCDLLNATVWASDGAHAVKIVNEKRVQMIANGEWK